MKSFREPPNTAVIVCKHAIKKIEPIQLVSHDKEDAGWQFLCNTRSHAAEDLLITALRIIVDLDPAVLEVADLPLGFIATREPGDKNWTSHHRES